MVIIGCFKVQVNYIFVRLKDHFKSLLLGEILWPVYVGDPASGPYLQSLASVTVNACWCLSLRIINALVHFYDFGGCQSPYFYFTAFSTFISVS